MIADTRHVEGTWQSKSQVSDVSVSYVNFRVRTKKVGHSNHILPELRIVQLHSSFSCHFSFHDRSSSNVTPTKQYCLMPSTEVAISLGENV